jgi:hypothetical protein
MARRKHTKQMSPLEREVLRQAIDSLDITSWAHFGDHSVDRLVEKGLSAVDIVNTIKFGEIIEAHNKKEHDIRVLLRQPTKRGSSVCVVVSLRDGNIVTGYENKNKDKHFTLDWSEYKWKVDLVAEVKMFMSRRNRRRGA